MNVEGIEKAGLFYYLSWPSVTEVKLFEPQTILINIPKHLSNSTTELVGIYNRRTKSEKLIIIMIIIFLNKFGPL